MENFIMKLRASMWKALIPVKGILADKRGSGMIDLVNIMISVVLGALVLGGLYLLFGSTVLPMLSDKIKAIFNYQG